jgi:hypothetical protein
MISDVLRPDMVVASISAHRPPASPCCSSCCMVQEPWESQRAGQQRTNEAATQPRQRLHFTLCLRHTGIQRASSTFSDTVCPKRSRARWSRQDRRRRPGPLALANPFALHRELLPTSPNFLDHIRTHHTLSVSPHHPPAALELLGCLTCRHPFSGTTYHVQRSNSKMSSVRLPPRPPIPRHARRLSLPNMPASSH